MKEKGYLENKYDDIINLPHHISKHRPQMSIHDRAAQFSPFSALTGYDDAIKESGRLTDSFIELEDHQKSILDEKLQLVFKNIKEYSPITITYFEPDLKKSGGHYYNITGNIKKINTYDKYIVMEDNRKILMKYIYNIII